MTLPFAFALFSSEASFADAFQSPYIVPVFGTLMILGIVVASIWSGVRTREMASAERLAAIARGLPVEPTFDEVASREPLATSQTAGPHTRSRLTDGAGARRAGLILLFSGLGLMAFFFALAVIVQVREVLSGAAAGLVPALIGVGFLIDGRLRRVEYQRFVAAATSTGTQRTELGPLH